MLLPARTATEGHALAESARPTRAATLFVAPLAVLALLLHAWWAVRLLLAYPQPWPDEALFVDAAMHLQRTGVLGSDLYRETLPSLSRHFDLVPPLHPVLLAGVFAVFGAGLAAARWVSVAFGIAGLALAATIARRAGCGRVAALATAALTSVHLLYVRGAHVARMDVLALDGVLLAIAIALAIGARPPAPARVWLGLGGVCGLAVLAHPLGLVAVPASLVVIAAARTRDADAGRHVPWGARVGAMAVGFVLALVPWAIYVARDPSAFAAQMGQQLHRKSALALPRAVDLFLEQWPLPHVVTLAVLGAGVLGLAALGRERAAARGLWLAQVMVIAAAVSSGEGWYAAYVMPLTALGLVRAVQWVRAPDNATALAGAAATLLVAAFAVTGVVPLTALALAPRSESPAHAYATWCDSIAAAIPYGSEVLVDCIPAPNFGLPQDAYRLRFFRPQRFAVSPDVERASLQAADYFVTGPLLDDLALAQWLRAHGRHVATVKHGDLEAVVFRNRREPTPATRP